jgi:hypothetical protein
VIDSLQMTAKHRVATPADWKQGDDVIIAGSVSDDEAKTIYPQGWKSPKPYIRIVPQPKPSWPGLSHGCPVHVELQFRESCGNRAGAVCAVA